jgi:hypothetical protein
MRGARRAQRGKPTGGLEPATPSLRGIQECPLQCRQDPSRAEPTDSTGLERTGRDIDRAPRTPPAGSRVRQSTQGIAPIMTTRADTATDITDHTGPKPRRRRSRATWLRCLDGERLRGRVGAAAADRRRLWAAWSVRLRAVWLGAGGFGRAAACRATRLVRGKGPHADRASRHGAGQVMTRGRSLLRGSRIDSPWVSCPPSAGAPSAKRRGRRSVRSCVRQGRPARSGCRHSGARAPPGLRRRRTWPRTT